MGRAQRGFSLIETAVAVAVAAVLLAAGGVWILGTHPGALRSGVDGVDAALAAARSIAATSGNGATIAFLPRSHGGFVVRVFSGRPNAAGAVHATNVLAATSDAIVREQTYGAPPFAVFLSSAGHPSGIAAYPQLDSVGNPSFPALSAQPPCPAGGVVLRIASPQGAPIETRTLSCDSSANIASAANPSPTPNVPILTPKALLAHWTSDASALQFVATEWGYTHWFASATGLQCGSIATYPSGSPYSAPQNAAEATATPMPPPVSAYSYPNAAGGSMNDAPAAFHLQPIAGAPGFCTADIVDAFGQHATAGVQIMGDLASSASSLTFASPTDAAQSVAFSKVFDNDPAGIQLRFGGNCAQVIAFPPSVTTRRIAASISSTDASSTTISVQPNGTIAAHCNLLVSDQYGEPPVTLSIAIGHPQMRSWPLAVKYAQSGQTFVANANSARDPIAFVNRILGGANADAATPCKAQAFTDATFSTPDTTPPSNVITQMLSLGITVDPATGCFMASGAPTNAPLTVWEPDGSRQTYTPSLNSCGFLVNAGTWSPISASGPIASLGTASGNRDGSCIVSISDGSRVTLSPGYGIVNAEVITSDIIETYVDSGNTTCTKTVSMAGTNWTCRGTLTLTVGGPNCQWAGVIGTTDVGQIDNWGAANGNIDMGPQPSTPSAWTSAFATAANRETANADPYQPHVISGSSIVDGCP